MQLRKFKLSDAERVAYLVGNRAVSRWTSNIPYPYSISDAEEWIKSAASSKERQPYAVEVDGQIVACVSYWPHEKDSVEVGYWVGKEYWDNGIATESLKMLLSSAKFPSVSTVVARIMQGNIGSKKVLLKCGFEFEAKCTISSKSTEINGEFYTKAIKT